jgi:hypothetical protein
MKCPFLNCIRSTLFYLLQDEHGAEEGGEGDMALKKKEHKQQSQKVLSELKSVLVVKEQEFQV